MIRSTMTSRGEKLILRGIPSHIFCPPGAGENVVIGCDQCDEVRHPVGFFPVSTSEAFYIYLLTKTTGLPHTDFLF